MDCLANDTERYEKLKEMEYYKRLEKGFLTNIPIWEGNTWIIDLLPDYPKLALEVLHAYFIAHIQQLPDGRVDGLQDAMALIRAKFIQEPNSEILLTLDPYQFEHVVDSLFMEMGYSTVLTRRTYDGGLTS
jgi:restriction system protein